MKKGQKVKVFQKPITDEDFEGIAELVKKHNEDGEGLEYWTVKFLEGCDSKHGFQRWIKEQNIVP